MKLKVLSAGELEELYHTELVRAFPPEELKPLSSMLRMMEQDRYQVLGMMDEEGLHGYALFWLEPGIPFALLDYFGTVEGQRNSGLGTRMLSLLADFYKDYRGIFGEAEAVTSSDPEEAHLQARRLEFYRRNGLRYAGYDCALFGVHFRTLILDKGDNAPEDILAAHQRIYRGGLPSAAYERFIQIPLREGEAVRPAADWIEE